MARRLMTMSIALLLVGLPAQAGGVTSPVTARLADCSESERVAVFEGDIRRVKGAVRLQVRFMLQARTPDSGRWGKIKAPGFGTWNTSAPGVRRYVYTKRVENLVGPGAYRVRVDFRWVGGQGRILSTTRRTTPSCKVPDPRPELAAAHLTVLPSLVDPARRRYDFDLANDGPSASGSFAVVLTIDGVAQPPAEILSLTGGEIRDVSLEGPPCTPGSEVVVEVDARDEVIERDEGNDVLRASCPAPA